MNRIKGRNALQFLEAAVHLWDVVARDDERCTRQRGEKRGGTASLEQDGVNASCAERLQGVEVLLLGVASDKGKESDIVARRECF
jgi:hypothetical protein